MQQPRKVTTEQILGVLQLCFEKGYSQARVAKRLKRSPAWVSKIVERARQLGYISVTVNYPPNHVLSAQLEAVLAESHSAVNCVLVASSEHGSVGQLAARYFEQNAQSGMTVVLDGGRSVRTFVESLAIGRFHRIAIAPLCADPPSYEVSAYELMTRMSVKYPIGVRLAKLPHHRGPTLEHAYETVRAVARSADFVFLGSGPWQAGFTAIEFVRHLGLSPGTLLSKYPQICCMSGYIGLDVSGKAIRVDEIEQLLPRALDINDIRKLVQNGHTRVILMASSLEKVQAVRATVAAGLCNTLVIDEDVASCLIE